VTGEHVTRVLGATPFELTARVVDAIADTDAAAALAAVQGLLDGGHDLRRFSLDLARHLRDLLVLAAAPGVDGLVDTTAERRARLVEQAARFGTDTLVRAVELVGEVLVEQRQGPPRLPLELAIARLATPGADGDVLALADRVSRLEQAIGEGGSVPAPAAGARSDRPDEPDRPDSGEEEAAADDVAADEPEADGSPSDGAAAAAPAGEAVSTEDADGSATEAGAGDGDDAGSLAERAARLADESGQRPPPASLEKRPGTTTVERDPVEPAPSGGDKLEQIAAGWEQILDVVGDASRRAKAFYEPATPRRLGKGVLLLHYPADKRFHAEQGKSGEMTAHLASAVAQVTGMERIKVDVQLSDDGPRRPSHPEVVDADGPADDEPSPAEVAAVTEVERAPEPSEAPDQGEVDELLRTELGAHKLDDV
jgi:DNA polymerase-3 subunit gamma/tau